MFLENNNQVSIISETFERIPKNQRFCQPQQKKSSDKQKKRSE